MLFAKHIASGIVYTGIISLAAGIASAADLSDIIVEPQQDQTAEQIRRDRYECHNWAVNQTGSVPAPGPTQEEARRERRSERVGKVLAGAAVGAAVGGVVRGARDHHDVGEGVLAGGVLGAIAGAIAGDKAEPDYSDDYAFTGYYRALSACMNARGYIVGLAEPR